MNPNNPQPSRDDIEVRLTALLLGELPPAEAELLRWSISQDPELANVHDRLKRTIGLVRAVAASPDEAATGTSAPLKISEERRQKLLAHFKTITPKEFAPLPARRRKFGWLMPLAAALMVGALLAVFLPPTFRSGERARVSSLGVYDSMRLPEAETLASTKSLKHDKNAGAANAPRPSADAIVETNGVEFAFSAPAPSLPPTTPIVLPPAVDSIDNLSPAPSPQPFTTPASGLPLQNPFIGSYSFVASNTGGTGGGGGGGFGGFGGIAGKPSVTWGSSGNNNATSLNSSGAVIATPSQPSLLSEASYGTSGQTGQSTPPGGVYSQSIVGYATTFDDTKGVQLSSVPAAGEVAKKSKDEGVSLAATLDSSHAIVLPTGSDTYTVSLAGGSTIARNGVGRQDLGISAGAGLPAPQVTTASGRLSGNFQNSDQNGNNGQIDNRQNSTGQSEKLFYRNPVPATAAPNEEQIPIHYAQPGDITFATRKLETREQKQGATILPSSPPAELPVATDVPPPSPDSVPPEQAATVNVASDAATVSIPASAANPIGAFPGNTPAPQMPPQDDLAPQSPPEPAPIPQPEVATKDNAFSTFSLNVSDVSFKLAAASLEHNAYPKPGSIRSEEFINAFDYRDPEPPAGAPVGFAWERAGDPFAHNRDFLRFSIKTAAEGRAPGRPLNLVLLLDKSGSMERADRVAIIHEALRVLATQLGPHDTLSVITFARTARLYVDGVPGSQADDVFGKLSGITPEGGTNLEEAMNLAYQTALRHYLEGGVNRVVLMTDGAANLGNVDPQHFKQKVEANRKQGIALDCFGIGWEDYNDDLLELLASHGDGRYGFLNTPEEASSGFATQLAGAFKVTAADVKVQVEFNPARVTAFRQIGYASHQLTKQQFRDNTVDAAVIGAAESGNAMYIIKINPQGDGPVATVRVRFRVPGTSEVQEHSWLVPYTGTAVALDQASPAMRLAATAGTFAEWLMASPTTEGLNLDQLLDYLKGVPEVYGTDPRPKQLEWMIRQAKNFAGKGGF